MYLQCLPRSLVQPSTILFSAILFSSPLPSITFYLYSSLPPFLCHLAQGCLSCLLSLSLSLSLSISLPLTLELSVSYLASNSPVRELINLGGSPALYTHTHVLTHTHTHIYTHPSSRALADKRTYMLRHIY